MIPDNPIYAARRKAMCRDLEDRIPDKRVLTVMESIPRHIFMEDSLINFAYENKAYPIGCGQTISQPFTVAFQTMLLNIQPNEKVLEIGTGSGYQAAVLCGMGGKVYSIERQQNLYLKTSQLLKTLAFNNLTLFCGDGYEGLPQYAPFDKIIVTAGASELPQTLLKQLKVGGVMVIPMGGEQMNIYKITRVSETSFKQERKDFCDFVPMLKGVDNRPL